MSPRQPVLLILSVAALASPAAAQTDNWRAVARPADARRIERLNEAWRAGLSEARAGGHARELKALGALADPKVALNRPHPAPGDYRCRTIKLGSQDSVGLPYVPYGWFRCRVELTPGGDLILSKTTGSQRPTGLLYPQGDRRLVFLGGLALGDERTAGRYGQSPDRDQAGVFERIGANRYRLALPWPQYESKLDLIEVVR